MSFTANGSPALRKAAAQFMIHDDAADEENKDVQMIGQGSIGIKRSGAFGHGEKTMPLTTSKLANQQSSPMAHEFPLKKLSNSVELKGDEVSSPVGHLLAYINSTKHLSDEKKSFARGARQTSETDYAIQCDDSSAEGLEQPIDRFGCSIPVTRQSSSEMANNERCEIARLKKELETAQEQLASMGKLQRNSNEILDSAIGTTSDTGSPQGVGLYLPLPVKDVQRHYELATQTPSHPIESWNVSQDGSSDHGLPRFPPSSFENRESTWSSSDKWGVFSSTGPYQQSGISITNGAWDQPQLNSSALSTTHNGIPPRSFPAPQNRKAPNLRIVTHDRSYPNITGNALFDHGYGSSGLPPSRPNSGFRPYLSCDSYAPSISSNGLSPPMTPMSFQQMNMNESLYQPRPIGTPLSPTAVEFNAPWNPQPVESCPTYVPPVEPMNYRRLLDRNMSCNWKYIVDKIVCNNDQQASIFLQQKLKVATADQKFDMIDAILTQAYPLMINRFGNFLIQRCFEHGTPEQVIAIGNTIRGHTLALSMDPFGCHVVQKAFDVVPEEYKAIMVHELLRRIPETVIHRYACHVWQKLFELRWSDSPPQIMKYVNEALRGMWHEVALGETGSLVVQNIFENCLEEDKRPCINEVLSSIDIISHGQFGNWCIQHICEHGAPTDKSRATEHVLRFATEYSMDQFASKVIEKCLKVGNAEFLERYLDKVCEARQDRPRMPLIDIAGDQYGNYLVQWILINANPQHREIVANHIRKHMVSLRGSKFGSRVAMLCCNPAFATRPGAPTGMQTNRFLSTNNGPRSGFGGAFR